ncbi:MAG: hypothetical protein ACD_11C00024G0009 [uncultured bacterium]|nr:MAG: hypothetical protein ACD_11C00024G0009 [uncultured bacterium]HBR72036.1 alanine--tRNA ligase [Candidatus Moranbacteria bacterium]
MTVRELRQKYLDFFKSKEHTIIPSASLIPAETDGSTFFTTAGMHPLVPYLMGENHPGGKRVANVQKCVRMGDIDDVGDNRHLTFFEMMGNWSFGDYFKKEAIEWSFEFLTDKEKGLGIDPKRIYVTTFKGENSIPKDEESIEIWKNIFQNAGIETEVSENGEVSSRKKIISLGAEDNFWIAGEVGPCGPDTEMFYDTRPEEGEIRGDFQDLVNSGRLIEIWNDVFMEYEKRKVESEKQKDEKYEYVKLSQKNVDTGMGVERTLAVLNGKENVFETELFQPIFENISELSGKKYEDHKKEFRIIADHIRASVFMISDGATPLNVGRGYVLRRIIRRAVEQGRKIGIDIWLKDLAAVIIDIYSEAYPELVKNRGDIVREIRAEVNKFRKTLEVAHRKLEAETASLKINFLDAKIRIIKKVDEGMVEKIFKTITSDGLPYDMAIEAYREKGFEIDENALNILKDKLEKHKALSRTASAGMFKGGLQGMGEMETKYHTATHLLLAALRKVLGNHVYQKGSNITAERLRFDFSYPEKMTAQQIAEVEELVNAAIGARLDVVFEEMSLDEAKNSGAMGVFGAKYGDVVKVYSIINDQGEIVSKEICGGPHVKNIGDLGRFRIKKEEASSAGVRRIKAVLEY